MVIQISTLSKSKKGSLKQAVHHKAIYLDGKVLSYLCLASSDVLPLLNLQVINPEPQHLPS